jgi:hypothetical protein
MGISIPPVFIGFLIAACPVASSTEPDNPRMQASQPWFGSELEAVVSASDRFNPISISADREFIGAILRLNGRYTFTVSAGARGADQVTARIAVPAGAEITAFWHTHGGPAPSNRFYSDVDSRLVRLHNKPFYLADHTGMLKILRPGGRLLPATRAQRLGLPRQNGFSAGNLVRDSSGQPVRIALRLKPW